MPMPDTPADPVPPVTVIVATRDRPAMLRRCLQAVAAATRPGDAVVVVDSASVDPAVRSVAEEAGATVVRCDRPGTSRARNAGWRAAASDVVLFTDDDCAPAPDWVRVTAGVLARCPSLDFATGSVHPDRVAGRAELGTSLLTDDRARSLELGNDVGGFGHGANMAWRRSALERIGGFDEALGPGAVFRGAEDHDAFERALWLGCRGRFEQASVVVHHQWRDRRGQLHAYFGYGVGTGARTVKRRRIGAAERTGGHRTDGDRGAPPLPWPDLVADTGRTIVWENGVRTVVRNLRDHFEMAAVGEAVKTVGQLSGAVRARRAPLDRLGRFVVP